MAHGRSLGSKRKLLKTRSIKRRRRRTIRKMRGGGEEDNAKRMIELLSEYQDTGDDTNNKYSKIMALSRSINALNIHSYYYELNTFIRDTTTTISRNIVFVDGTNLKRKDDVDGKFSCSITAFNNALPEDFENKIETTDEYNTKRMIKVLSQYKGTGDEGTDRMLKVAELERNIEALNSSDRSTSTILSSDTVKIDGTNLKYKDETYGGEFSCSITAFNNAIPKDIDRVLTSDQFSHRLLKNSTQTKRSFFSRFNFLNTKNPNTLSP